MNTRLECYTKKILIVFSLWILIFSFLSCSVEKKQKSESSSKLEFSSLNFSVPVPLSYAKQFSIKKSEAPGYSIAEISGEKPLLVIEENFQLPEGIPAEYIVLKKPLTNTYLVSSSAMDFFVKLNLLDYVKFSGTKKENFYLPEAVKAMEDEKIIYAGKYSTPDYELLYSGKTNISIQNTMIYHKPEAKEKLEKLNIPVIVEKSSYEKNPLGRTEWIKFYGLLYGKEKEAEEFFNSKIKDFSNLKINSSATNSTAFFYFTSSGTINVRKPEDYIAKSIEMAGGKYFLENKNSDDKNAVSTMNLQPEDFYINAKDCDFLIYNSSIEGMISDKNLLLKKYPLLKDFKAFTNGKLYCTNKKLFQETTGTVDFMKDLNKIFNDDETNLHYLVKIK